MATTTLNREIRLKQRPVGLPSEHDFELVEVPLPALQDGHVLVRNHYMSVDPYMRGRMYDRPSYVPPFRLGQPLEGGCVTASPGPSNLAYAVRKRLTLQGFIVSDHMDRQPQFQADMAAWMQAGKIKWEETIIDGLEHAPKAFIGLFTGDNIGKMLVKLV